MPPLEKNWFYVNTPDALADLRLHAGEITALIPFWFGITAGGLQIKPIRSFGRGPHFGILFYQSKFCQPSLGPYSSTAHYPTARNVEKHTIMLALPVCGVNIDFEFVPGRPSLSYRFYDWIGQLPGRLFGYDSVPAQRDNPRHPFSGAFSYPALGA